LTTILQNLAFLTVFCSVISKEINNKLRWQSFTNLKSETTFRLKLSQIASEVKLCQNHLEQPAAAPSSAPVSS
jgi:hypothetical protein